MRVFTHALDERLQSLVTDETASTVGTPARPRAAAPPEVTRERTPEAHGGRRRRLRPRRFQAAVGGATAIGTVAVSAILLSGTSAAGLPVLQTPTADATNFAKGVQLSAHDVDFRAAHILRSAQGDAAILTNRAKSETCLAIPDPLIVHSPIGTCAPTATVERRGLLVQARTLAKAGQPAPHGAFAFILPVGATDARLFDGVEDLHPAVQAGVVLAYPEGAAQLRYRLDGATVTVSIPGPFVGDTGACVDAKTGVTHTFTPTTDPGSDAGGAPGHLPSNEACS